MPQVSSVIDFELAQRVRDKVQAGANRAQSSALYAETSQLISQQLQATLDVDEMLELFFRASQHLVRYDGLHYVHTTQKISLSAGSSENVHCSVNYRLTFDGEYLGDLFMQSSKPFREHELVSFESLTTSLIYPLRNGLKYHAALQSALLDPLTGTGNRASMSKTLQRDMDTALRFHQPLSVIMLDIDFFKRINDNFGHACGDLVLIEVANLLKAQLRNTDAVFRFGGEEFLITLPNTDADQVCRAGERIRRGIEKLELDYAGQSVRLSVSLGCAVMQAKEEQDSLLHRADQALYAAKRQGKNRLNLSA